MHSLAILLVCLVPIATVSATAGTYSYEAAIPVALQFYQAQRSGVLPANKLAWRGNSATQDFAVGGYYDAGDNVKFGLPMAGSMTILAWSGITFSKAYSAAGSLFTLVDTIKWGTDYFIAAHPSATLFYHQFGTGATDHSYWYSPEDNIPSARTAYTVSPSCPGSDVAGETAAALAAASIFFKSLGNATYTTYAATCLTHAQSLYNFAYTYRGKYSDCSANSDANSFYPSTTYQDELGWAAAWLYLATGSTNATLLAQAVSFYQYNPSTPTNFDWDNKNAGLQILLYQITKSSTYLTAVQNFVTQMTVTTPKTPMGLTFYNAWGPLRHAANFAHACLQIATLGVDVATCEAYAKAQIGYILGDAGHSYVVGYGTNPPTHCHHRGASCPLPSVAICGWNQYNSAASNLNTITGALVGGPGSDDSYADVRSDYQKNEVTCDYNAGFTGALAGLTTVYQLTG